MAIYECISKKPGSKQARPVWRFLAFDVFGVGFASANSPDACDPAPAPLSNGLEFLPHIPAIGPFFEMIPENFPCIFPKHPPVEV